jgi:hypothetical protein
MPGFFLSGEKAMNTWNVLLLGSLLVASASSQAQIVEERVTERNGVYETCGVGEGLSACRDYNGETYEEETGPRDVKLESDDQMAAEAARIRKESPAELEATITEMENNN